MILIGLRLLYILCFDMHVARYRAVVSVRIKLAHSFATRCIISTSQRGMIMTVLFNCLPVNAFIGNLVADVMQAIYVLAVDCQSPLAVDCLVLVLH
jgi:hypothetical protein